MSDVCNNIWETLYNGNGYAPCTYSPSTVECQINNKNTVCNNQGILDNKQQSILNSKNNVQWLDTLTTCHHELGSWCDKCNFKCKFDKLTNSYVNTDDYKHNTLLCCTQTISSEMTDEERVTLCDKGSCPGTQTCLTKVINICKDAYKSNKQDSIVLCKKYENFLLNTNANDYQNYVDNILTVNSNPSLIYDLCSNTDCSSFLNGYCSSQLPNTSFTDKEKALLINPDLKKICGCNLSTYPLKGFVPKECLSICNNSQNLGYKPCQNNICYFDKTSIDNVVPPNSYFDLSIVCDTPNRNILKTCFFSSDIGTRMVGSGINLNTVCSACYNSDGVKTDCNSYLNLPLTSSSIITTTTTNSDNFWINNKQSLMIILGIIIVIFIMIGIIFLIVKYKLTDSNSNKHVKVVYVKEPKELPLIPEDTARDVMYI
jgi:hypothetical protein